MLERTPCSQLSSVFIGHLFYLGSVCWAYEKYKVLYSSKHLVLIIIQCMKLVELGKSTSRLLLRAVCCCCCFKETVLTECPYMLLY